LAYALIPLKRDVYAHLSGLAGIKTVRAKVENPNISAECSKSFSIKRIKQELKVKTEYSAINMVAASGQNFSFEM
jgi:hypothetical protein